MKTRETHRAADIESLRARIQRPLHWLLFAWPARKFFFLPLLAGAAVTGVLLAVDVASEGPAFLHRHSPLRLLLFAVLSGCLITAGLYLSGRYLLFMKRIREEPGSPG